MTKTKNPDYMLLRFSLYGFLKNQQYYEPFILLAFLDKGLSFLSAGLLFSLGEIMALILEIPSGALADLYGRRRIMALSFGSYIVSFILLATCNTLPLLATAMVFFGIGQAFRTGTHKAMIMEWLQVNDRLSEKTKVYGYTRSWSKKGSAISALISGLIVYYTRNYSMVFYLSSIPYVIGLLNFSTYPSFLDGQPSGHSPTIHLKETFMNVSGNWKLRNLFWDTMVLDGSFTAIKKYIQVMLRNLVLTLPLWTAASMRQREAIVIPCIYFIFHLFESSASKNAHVFKSCFTDEETATSQIWKLFGTFYLAMTVLLSYGYNLPALTVFIVSGGLYNIWRPLQVGRYQNEAPPSQRSTVLSMESQSKSLATAILAPVAGYLIDLTQGRIWPATALMGILILSRIILKRFWKRKG